MLWAIKHTPIESFNIQYISISIQNISKALQRIFCLIESAINLKIFCRTRARERLVAVWHMAEHTGHTVGVNFLYIFVITPGRVSHLCWSLDFCPLWGGINKIFLSDSENWKSKYRFLFQDYYFIAFVLRFCVFAKLIVKFSLRYPDSLLFVGCVVSLAGPSQIWISNKFKLKVTICRSRETDFVSGLLD